MSVENPSGNNPANQGGNNSSNNPNKSSGKNNRRRSLRSKRRGRKPGEGGEVREPREQPAAPKPTADKIADKNVRDNRDRRRRRRMRAKQRGPNDAAPAVVEDVLKDLPPLVPAFVYTHVLRPAMRDTFEFRTEHFSKVTRQLEDFHIDLSPLYPDGGDEIKGVAYVPPLAERQAANAALDGDNKYGDNEDDDESYDDEPYDADWEIDNSPDAALLDGASTQELKLLGDILEENTRDDDESLNASYL
jgi:hypothetical protein